MKTKKRRTVTVSDVRRWFPCRAYTEKHLEYLFAGRTRVGAKDIVKMRIPTLDKIWALSQMLTHDEQLGIIDRLELVNEDLCIRGTRDALWGHIAKGCKGYRARDGEPIYEYSRDQAKRAIVAAVKILEGEG
jgi:hypothetical protein